MSYAKKDLAILEQFDFEAPPVGVKFSTRPPDRIKRLDENLAFCEMLKRAQEGKAFFADAQSHTCEAGLYVLGQAEAPGPYISGEFGAGLKIFEEPRAAGRLYQYIPRVAKGVVLYTAFSPIPDLHNPEGTRAAFWEGEWLRSGDIGLFDEQGYLYIMLEIPAVFF